MSLRITIRQGEVVTWEYRGTAEPTHAPAYREPIRLDPAYDRMLTHVARAMGQNAWDLLKKYGG